MTTPAVSDRPLAGTEVHFINRSYWPAVGGVERQLGLLEDLVDQLGGAVVIWTATNEEGRRSISVTGRRPRRPSCPRWVHSSPRLFLVWASLGLLLHRALHPRSSMVLLAGRASAETAAALPVRLIFGVPLITYLAGGDVQGSEFSCQRRRWLRREMARRVDVFVAHAPSYLDEVQDAGHRGTRLVSPTIVPADRPPGCQEELVAGGAVKVLWCGRNHPVKGLDRLAGLADGALREAGASLTVIADNAPDMPSHVHVHCGCSSPRSHMGKFDVLVLTSRYEGQPNVMAEAALEGVPTVALGVGGIPEAVSMLGHGTVLRPDCPDTEFTAAVTEAAASYRNPRLEADLRAAAVRLYGDAARQGWQRAFECAASVRSGQRQFARIVGALTAGRGVASLLSGAWLIGAARELGAAAFGRLSVILAVGGLLDIVSDMGIPLNLTHLAATGGPSRSVVRKALGIRVLLDVPAVAALLLVCRFATGGWAAAPLIFGVSIVASSVYSTYTAVLRGQGALRIEAANDALSRLAVVVIGLSWLSLGGGLVAAVGTYALADLASAVVVPTIAQRRIRWVETGACPPERLSVRSTLPLASASAVNIIYYRLDVWILAILSGPVAVAAYSVAGRLADVVMLPSRALNSVSLNLSESSGPRLRLRQLSARSLAMTAPSVLVGFVAVGTVLPRVLGSGYRAAVGPSRILLLSCLLTAVLLAIAPTVAVRRRTLFLGASTAALVTNVLLNLALIPRLGATGAAIASLGSEILLVWILAGLSRTRLLGDHIHDLLEQIDRRLTPQTCLQSEREL